MLPHLDELLAPDKREAPRRQTAQEMYDTMTQWSAVMAGVEVQRLGSAG